MGLYEFTIIDKDGNTLASLDGARRRFFAEYLNKPGQARFSIDPMDPKLTSDLLLLGHKELQILRGGSLVWGGELLYRRTDLSAESELIEITAKGYLDLLSRRIVGTTAGSPVYYPDSWDISDIAHDLVSDSQALANGDFGVTSGTNPASRNGERTYEFKNLLEAIQGLSNDNVANGIDFEITAAKQFNTYYPAKGRQLPEVVFEWGVNITQLYEIQDATRMVNQAIVLGAGEGGSMLTATRNATTQQGIYKLRQSLLSHKDVVIATTLEEHGDEELSQHSAQSQIVGITTRGDLSPTFGSYEVGDSVRVKVNRGVVQIDGFYRIYGIEVRIGEEDEEEITLIFNPS